MLENEIIVKDTHRGLWYEDGVLVKVLEAGRYKIPECKGFFGPKGPYAFREGDLRLRLHTEFDEAFSTTKLPERPDYNWVNEFPMKARCDMVHQ